MRQLIQDISGGRVKVEEVAAPRRPPGFVLVATQVSLISAGTERAALEMGRASILGKARARPDLVRDVLANTRSEGVAATYAKVTGRLAGRQAPGYSLCGTVLEAGEDSDLVPGEMVACAGAGHACHAEVVAVPRNLCARVPAGGSARGAPYPPVGGLPPHAGALPPTPGGGAATRVGLRPPRAP